MMTRPTAADLAKDDAIRRAKNWLRMAYGRWIEVDYHSVRRVEGGHLVEPLGYAGFVYVPDDPMADPEMRNH